MNEEKNKIQIPKDWKWEKLDDALDFVIGGDWGKDENFEDSNYGAAYCIRGSEIKNWEEEKGRTASLRKIKLSNIEKRKLVEGDILVEISGGGPEQPVGRTVLIDKTVLSYKPEIPKICTNFLRLIRPKDYVEGKFLNLFLKLFYYSGEIVKYQGGSNNLRNLKFPDYVKINFPLPPKHIQQAIVSKIEELFSELDKGIENLRTAQQQLKTYRQSVLKWAFEGKLSEEWRGQQKNLPGGSKLLKQIQAEKEELSKLTSKKLKPLTGITEEERANLPKLTNKWTWVKLGDNAFVTKLAGFEFTKYVKYKETGEVPVIRAQNVSKTSFIPRNFLFVDREVMEKLPRSRVYGGEILMVFVGAGLGNVGIVPEKNEYFLGPNVAKIALEKQFNNKYIFHFLTSQLGFANVTGMSKATAQGSISMENIRQVSVPLISKEEQNKIVEEIESRLSVADKMEESITQSLQQAEILRQSILKKAFEGKLLPAETQSIQVRQAKVIPIERKVLATKIIYLNHSQKHFGLTKFQKLLYLVENFAEVEYDTNFLKETAGPYDKDFTLAFRKEMKTKDWFDEEQKGSIVKFIPGEKVGSLISTYAKHFRDKSKKIVFVLQQLQDKSTHESELIATLYAVWNNRLIKKQPLKIDLLVEDFFNWSSKKKEEFLEQEIKTTFDWMKEIKLVPKGFGRFVDVIMNDSR